MNNRISFERSLNLLFIELSNSTISFFFKNKILIMIKTFNFKLSIIHYFERMKEINIILIP